MRLSSDTPVGKPSFELSGDQLATVVDLLCRGAAAHRGMTAKFPFEKIWKLKGIDLEQVINGRFASSLRLILLSVLTNTKHSKYETDCIELERVDDLPHLPIMQLTYRSGTAVVDPDLIRGMFISPNINSDGWHFGMFLIGVHTRLLGGTVEIDPDCCKEVGYTHFSWLVTRFKDWDRSARQRLLLGAFGALVALQHLRDADSSRAP